MNLRSVSICYTALDEIFLEPERYHEMPEVGSVEWTKDGNPDKYLPEDVKRGKDGRPLAYRDLVMERIIKHAVSKYMVKVKNPLIFGWQRIKDPTKIAKKIHFTKKDQGLS